MCVPSMPKVAMIHLTRLNHTSFVLNSDLIEHLQATPDTVITLTNGRNYMVLETPDEIIERVVSFRSRIAPVDPRPEVQNER